mmetsp:Transcript_15/g.24  ORF Transcript_15/g.24 Transcript_15/m.24 type:complete len:529 (-) Transcript_15:159-1745(-)
MNNNFRTNTGLALGCILSSFVVAFCDAIEEKRKSIEVLHNSPRIFGSGSNEIPTDETEIGSYVAGAASVGILFLVWSICSCWGLCCLGCCRNGNCIQNNCNNAFMSLFLVFAIVSSCVGWLIAISGGVTLQEGLDDFRDGVSDFFDYLEDVEDSLNDVVNFAGSLAGDIVDANSTCLILQATGSGDLFPVDVLENFAEQTEDFALFGEGTISDVKAQVDDGFAQVDGYIDSLNFFIKLLTSIMMLILLLFGVSVLIRYLDLKTKINVPERMVSVNNMVYGKFTLLFVIGVIASTLVLYLAAIFSVLATIGSDVCYPSFTENAINVVKVFDTENGDPCISDGPDDLLVPTTCHYATCTGTNPLFDQLGLNVTSIEVGDFINVAVDGAAEIINGLITELNNTAFPGNITIPGLGTIDLTIFNQEKDQCLGAAADITNNFALIDDLFLAVFDLLLCETVTPIYQEIFENALCNGVVGGLAQLYLAWVVGSIGFTLAAIFYLLIVLDRKEQEKLATATVIPEEEQQGQKLSL